MVQASEYYKSWHGTYETDGGGPFIQYNSIEISGTEGSIIANFNEISSLHVTGLQKPECGEVVGGNERLFERLAVDFIHSIDENRRPFIESLNPYSTKLVWLALTGLTYYHIVC